MNYIEEYQLKFQTIKELQKKYQLDTKEIDGILKSIDTYTITTPVVGNFSTGKSSLLNAMIGQNLLGVEITPETAVPTEISYGKNKIEEYTEYGIVKHDFSELPLKNLRIDKTRLLKISHENDFLKEISNVSLVDLPGFDTNIELHNRAIDEYLPKSLAYLLVISADEPVLKESMTNFLKELKVHEMPVYVVITKCNRLLDRELLACKELIYQIVTTLMGRDVKIACTDSYGKVNVEEAKEFLREINTKTEELFCEKYDKLLHNMIKSMEFYFSERIDKRNLSTSELEYEQERLERKIDSLYNKLEKEKKDFNHQMEDCLSYIKARIQADLRATTDELAVMLENGIDVTEKLNLTIRSVVMLSIKTELEPNLQKYVNHVADVIQVELPNNADIMEHMKSVTSKSKGTDIGTKASPIVLAALGAILVHPLIGVVGVVAGSAAGGLFNSKWDRKKEREARKTAEKIVDEIGKIANDTVSKEIENYITKVNEEITLEVQKQKEILTKTIEDIKEQLAIEEGFKNNDLEKMQTDLAQLRQLEQS